MYCLKPSKHEFSLSVPKLHFLLDAPTCMEVRNTTATIPAGHFDCSHCEITALFYCDSFEHQTVSSSSVTIVTPSMLWPPFPKELACVSCSGQPSPSSLLPLHFCLAASTPSKVNCPTWYCAVSLLFDVGSGLLSCVNHLSNDVPALRCGS